MMDTSISYTKIQISIESDKKLRKSSNKNRSLFLDEDFIENIL